MSVGAITAGVAFDGTTTPPTAGGPTAAIAQGANVAEAINKISDKTGVTASVDDTGALTLTSTKGANIDIKVEGSYLAATLLTDTGLTGSAAGTVTTATTPTASATGYAAGDFKINGVEIGAIAGATTDVGQAANTVAAINLQSGKTGVTATANAVTGAVTLSAADGRDIKLEDGNGTAAAATGIAAGTFTSSVSLQSSNVNGILIGGKTSENAGLKAFEGMVAPSQKSTNTVSSVDVSTASGALAALSTIDAALSSVNSSKASLGAYQNRFTAVVSNLATTSENLSASRSRIQDADFAAETASLTRGQILQQAGTAMLAQANSLPNGVLALLRG